MSEVRLFVNRQWILCCRCTLWTGWYGSNFSDQTSMLNISFAHCKYQLTFSTQISQEEGQKEWTIRWQQRVLFFLTCVKKEQWDVAPIHRAFHNAQTILLQLFVHLIPRWQGFRPKWWGNQALFQKIFQWDGRLDWSQHSMLALHCEETGRFWS